MKLSKEKVSTVGMKAIDVDLSKIQLVEDDNYEGIMSCDKYQVSVYEVILFNVGTGNYIAPRYVLAPNEYEAMSQATCGTDLDGGYGERDAVAEGTKVRRLPLMMRGWGKREF